MYAVEVWLRTNSRALLLGMIVPAIVALLGAALLFTSPVWARAVGGGLLALGGLALAVLAWHLRHPRLAYQKGHVLFWLRSGGPICVPVEFVECFWLGQAPSLLPGKRHQNTETAALVVRIAQKAEAWHHQDVKPQLGKWCEGYVTIRGTWCQPLHIDLVNRLNERLAEVSRAAAR